MPRFATASFKDNWPQRTTVSSTLPAVGGAQRPTGSPSARDTNWDSTAPLRSIVQRVRCTELSPRICPASAASEERKWEKFEESEEKQERNQPPGSDRNFVSRRSGKSGRLRHGETPELTVGPYFVDERLNRSDLTTNTTDTNVTN